MGLFLAMIDTSIVATSLYTIGVDFKTVWSVNWVALAYSISYLSCAVTFARLSDVVGRRNAFLAAYMLFFTFSLVCGFAKSLNQLIAFRAVQGIGGSGKLSFLEDLELNRVIEANHIESCPRRSVLHHHDMPSGSVPQESARRHW
jgi:MFS family permease